MPIRVGRDSESTNGVRTRWVGLQFDLAAPEIGWGALWSALCGALAAGVFFRWDLDSLLRLVLVLVLADPLLANLGHLLGDVGSSRAGAVEHVERERARLVLGGLLPYAEVDSPIHRIAGWVERVRIWWGTRLRPRSGGLPNVGLQAAFALLIGLVLGPSVVALVVLGLIALALSGLLRKRCLDLSIGLRSFAEVGVACLIGYVSFAPWAVTGLGLAVVLGLVYGAALRASVKGVDGGTMLVSLATLSLPVGFACLQKPYAAALLGVAGVFPAWVSFYAVKRVPPARWYLDRVGPYLYGLTLCASVALGVG